MVLPDLFNLSGKTAVVTGGAGGLGQQIAISLAEAGAKVIVCSRDLEACENVKQHIESLGLEALALRIDITSSTSVTSFVNEVMRHCESIDILVNCSGISKHEDASTMSLSDWSDVIETNVTGVFLMCQAVGKRMIENGYGKIINISSVAGFRGYDEETHNSISYTTSKGAIHTFTKDLAVKWAPKGIYVNAIAPGVFLTKMNEKRLARVGKKIKQNIPLKKFGVAKDLIGAILYLASNASNHTTGQILAIDGGSSAK